MISLAEINSTIDKFRAPADTIEKDYVICWILNSLSKSKLKNDFQFYGGTAIKRVYFEDHRFSEDIDLQSHQNFSSTYLLQELDSLQYAKEKANLELEVKHEKLLRTKHRVQVFIGYSGYEEIIGTPKEVRLDFSMGIERYGVSKNKRIIPSYSDLQDENNNLSVLTLNTILANKLGLLVGSTRNEPRDLFDIWFLLNRIKKFKFDFFQVCKVFKEKYSFLPSLNILLPRLQSQSLKSNWEGRLSKQIASLPNIEIVIKDIEEKLKKLFSSK